MAVLPLCAKLIAGQDASCFPVNRKYYQQAVVINKTDIDPDSITVTKTDFNTAPETCAYNVSFALKAGKTGYRFTGGENGSIYFGRYNKTLSELTGNPQYVHEAQMLVVGVDEASKCILEALDKGRYVVAYQFMDGTVEIYGIRNGLSTADYTFSTQENGGGTSIILTSSESAPENELPLVYKSEVPGSETADFDAAFENTAS
ncbi:MAG TPA: hypothetical protein VFM82_03490 [Flavobacteriaceae bacterium]|nr:hypothetical protein [Flavobacteriaceae bacterium]